MRGGQRHNRFFCSGHNGDGGDGGPGEGIVGREGWWEGGNV